MRFDGPGRMVVISGPSGSGKSTICKRLFEDPRYVFSVSATTRTIRAGEVDGVDYHFLTPTQFREHIERGEFIEHAEVHGNLYGTLSTPIEKVLAEGKIYVLEIDVQGALQLKELGVPGLYIFIAPPDFDELRRRLVDRKTETPEALERRLHKAEDEYRERFRYDEVVVNDELEHAVAEVRGLIEARPAEPGPSGPESTREGAS